MTISSVSISAVGIFDLLAIILGAVFSGASCVSALVIFDLGKWLLYGGIGNLSASLLMFVAAANKSNAFFVKVSFARVLFMIAWFIVGVIIMSSMTPSCAAFNYTIYVMAIVYLVYLAIVAVSTQIVVLDGHKNSSTTTV